MDRTCLHLCQPPIRSPWCRSDRYHAAKEHIHPLQPQGPQCNTTNAVWPGRSSALMLNLRLLNHHDQSQTQAAKDVTLLQHRLRPVT